MILRNLDKAEEEVKNFDASQDETFLMQAAEKTYVAYTLLLEKTIKGEITSHAEIRNFSRYLGEKDAKIKAIYERCEILHAYHYEGRVDPEIIKNNISFSIREIKLKLRE